MTERREPPRLRALPNDAPAPADAPDTIEIDGLEVRAILGIFAHERDQRQEIRIGLRLHTDISAAARSDSIEHALDYKSVTKRIIEFVEASDYFLIERLIEEIAALALTEFDVRRVTVRVEKPGALRYARTVGITITRERND